MPRLQRSHPFIELYQGRRALKNGHLPLALIVRAFSALLERCNQIYLSGAMRFGREVRSERHLRREGPLCLSRTTIDASSQRVKPFLECCN
jgi:hypothetical protein